MTRDRSVQVLAEAFDWNKVGPELDAVSEAIAETVDADNIMQTNEASMEFLEYLWRLGYRVVPLADALERMPR